MSGGYLEAVDLRDQVTFFGKVALGPGLFCSKDLIAIGRLLDHEINAVRDLWVVRVIGASGVAIGALKDLDKVIGS